MWSEGNRGCGIGPGLGICASTYSASPGPVDTHGWRGGAEIARAAARASVVEVPQGFLRLVSGVVDLAAHACLVAGPRLVVRELVLLEQLVDAFLQLVGVEVDTLPVVAGLPVVLGHLI